MQVQKEKLPSFHQMFYIPHGESRHDAPYTFNFSLSSTTLLMTDTKNSVL